MGMPNMRASLILEQGHEKTIIPGTSMHRILLRRQGAGLDIDAIKAPGARSTSTGSQRRRMARRRLLSRPTLSARRRPYPSRIPQMWSRRRGNLRPAVRGHPLLTVPAHA
eukprot:1705934-Pyramimonas_sp.AAC.1